MKFLVFQLIPFGNILILLDSTIEILNLHINSLVMLNAN